ncbi:MAG TPA: acyl-CoA thioesterase [Sediminispirochaeta sp.]|nr:acyl-CoA thioesterase [Sediminispirochaeta sp.]
MKHQWNLEVRSYELDMHRHVNNATYLNYIEAARMDFLRTAGFDYQAFQSRGYSLFVSEIKIAYRAPAFLHDRLTVVTEALKRKRLSGVFRQTIYRGETVICIADVSWVCVNSDGRPAPIPREFDYPEFYPENGTIEV